MDSQIFTPCCNICREIVYFLNRYPCLSELQEIKNYHINVYQEYLMKYISGVSGQCKLCSHPEMLAEMEHGFAIAKEVWSGAIAKQGLFCRMDSCAKKAFINEHLIKIRDILIDEKPIGVLNFYYVQKVIDLDLSRCGSCLSCLDFISNLEIVAKLLCERMTVKEAKKIVYYNQRADIADQLIHLASTSPKPEFHTMKSYEKSEKKLVYLDSNIFMELEKSPKDSELRLIMERSKNCYDYYYSPSHLEDILKRDLSDVSVDPILSMVEEITGSLFIHRFDNKLRLDYELPQFSYKRIGSEHSKQITELVEASHIKGLKAGELFFPQYHTPEHKKEINNKDLFGRDSEVFERTLKLVGAGFDLENVKNLDIRNIEYTELNDIVYKLIRTMDTLNFWHEPIKNMKKLRSSVHDTEHLIYATYSDIFVTNDNPLYHRSKAILGHLMPNIQVMRFEEFRQAIL